MEPIPFTRVEITAEARAACDRVLASGWITTGRETLAFQREWADHVGADHCVMVSSCTAAIELCLRALELPPGSKVLTTTTTFCGVVNAILAAGHRPVFADLAHPGDSANVADTYMVSERTVREAADRAGGVDAMVVLHFAGHPADVEALARAARLPLSRVLEDAAHGIGTSVGDRMVGGISQATCFSFYPTKNLPMPEGGAVTTGDAAFAAKLTALRLHGMSADAWNRYLPGGSWRYTVAAPGMKANMTDVQAAIGREQMKHLPRWQARRDELRDRYDKRLAGLGGLGLPQPSERGRTAWHLYVVRVKPEFGMARDDLIAFLNERGVATSVHFIPSHTMPAYAGFAPPGGLPNAEAVFEQVVSLPLYPLLTDTQVDRVCAVVGEARAAGGAA
ncbi:MAG: DegT/DnrJ/EryC1/StrS aminotransferase family protein [Catenulispora sp.]|nr:DegT/DnrJ/EryC1/StrS aminotransferase family protein [Catenulispora sp.]